MVQFNLKHCKTQTFSKSFTLNKLETLKKSCQRHATNLRHAFFISNTFISNTSLKLAKSQADAKQHPEADLFLFENFSHLHSRYHPKIIVHILKSKQKKKYVCKNEDEKEK